MIREGTFRSYGQETEIKALEAKGIPSRRVSAILTSSPRERGSRDVILPSPLAAVHLTTVSASRTAWHREKQGTRRGEGKKRQAVRGQGVRRVSHVRSKSCLQPSRLQQEADELLDRLGNIEAPPLLLLLPRGLLPTTLLGGYRCGVSGRSPTLRLPQVVLERGGNRAAVPPRGSPGREEK